MRITKITAEPVAVPLAQPFVVSLGAIDSADLVYVKIETDDGVTGFGEASPTAFVTGETVETVLSALRLFEPMLLGRDPFAVNETHALMDRLAVRNGSAKAAVDLALYDIMAKRAGQPLYRFLGGERAAVETDMTIGLAQPEAMAARAAELAAQGYRHIKVKAGADDARDWDGIGLIRAAAPDAHLKVDANQAWTPARALRMLERYRECGVEAVEQPLPHWDIDGMAYVRSRSPIPIMADESCFTPQDAATIARRQAADIINIKLMKCGGLARALQINAVAQSFGLNCMLGCMLESRLAIAAGAHLVASHPNFVYADLDSFTEFDDTGVVTQAFDYRAPVIALSETPGIGVQLSF
jgi:L-alanine-DL-glutamate epimerase-like enolase superfamily enzyme